VTPPAASSVACFQLPISLAEAGIILKPGTCHVSVLVEA